MKMSVRTTISIVIATRTEIAQTKYFCLYPANLLSLSQSFWLLMDAKDTGFRVDKSLPYVFPSAVYQVNRFSQYFWWQKYQNHPHVVLRRIVFRLVLSGRSKIEPLQPPAPGARVLSRSFSAPNENADLSRRQQRRMIPTRCRSRNTQGGLKARAKGTVCLQTREQSPGASVRPP